MKKTLILCIFLLNIGLQWHGGAWQINLGTNAYAFFGDEGGFPITRPDDFELPGIVVDGQGPGIGGIGTPNGPDLPGEIDPPSGTGGSGGSTPPGPTDPPAPPDDWETDPGFITPNPSWPDDPPANDDDPFYDPGGSPGDGSGGKEKEETKTEIELMDKSKFVGFDEAGNDCMKAVVKIMGNYKTPTGSSAHVYKLITEDSKAETIHNWGANPDNNYKKAVACIDRHLEAKRPIVVGIHYRFNSDINEGTTDHFVVITGRGYDSSLQMRYFTFMETSRFKINASAACNTTTNRLYYDDTLGNQGIFRIAGTLDNEVDDYSITQVRPNDGQKLTETVPQSTK